MARFSTESAFNEIPTSKRKKKKHPLLPSSSSKKNLYFSLEKRLLLETFICCLWARLLKFILPDAEENTAHLSCGSPVPKVEQTWDGIIHECSTTCIYSPFTSVIISKHWVGPCYLRNQTICPFMHCHGTLILLSDYMPGKNIRSPFGWRT